MNRKRAKEIASSLEMINVTYNESPIYIETINPTKDSASIHYLDQPHNSQEVLLIELVESENK